MFPFKKYITIILGSLCGYIFFGSAIDTLNTIKDIVQSSHLKNNSIIQNNYDNIFNETIKSYQTFNDQYANLINDYKKMIILDFENVVGVNSTAIRSCFQMLVIAKRKIFMKQIHLIGHNLFYLKMMIYI